MNRRTSIVVFANCICFWAAPAVTEGSDAYPFTGERTEAQDFRLDDPTGSCCIDGVCVDNITEYECVIESCGQWLGEGTACLGYLCPMSAIGLCCTDGVCDDTIGADTCECGGGSWQTDASDCGGYICQGGPTGSCCIDGACVEDITEFECVIESCGRWRGAGTSCAGVLCETMLPGVCCIDEVCNEGMGFDTCECAEGQYYPGIPGCDGFECAPLGYCCYGATCYDDYTEAECDTICGVWGGAGTQCFGPVPPCQLQFGACCIDDTCEGGLGDYTCTCLEGEWHSGASCQLSEQTDCNDNGIIDVCEEFEDCNLNGIPDECETDCNENGIPDDCDIADGTSQDINGNGIPDECEPDCNGNGFPDDMDLVPGEPGKIASAEHTPGLAIPDCGDPGDPVLENALPVFFPNDCGTVEHLTVTLEMEHTWVGDLVVELESPSGTVVGLMSRVGLAEVNPYCGGGECCGEGSGIVAVQLADTFLDSVEDGTGLVGDFHPDAGATGYSGELLTFAGEDECGIWTLRVHDGAEGDVGTLGGWSLNFRTFPVSKDCNQNDVPDECDIADGTSNDCNENGIPDDCEDCNGNGLADECDIADGTSQDCNENGIPDECEAYRDCNFNGQFDECDIEEGISEDCNENGVPDECDISGYAGLFVAGLTSQTIVTYDAATGSLVGPFGPVDSSGSCLGLEFGPNGNLLASDSAVDVIQQYDGDSGESLEHFIDMGTEGLVDPGDLEIGPNGNLFVLRYTSGEVYEYDGWTGEPVGAFCQPEPAHTGLSLDMIFGPNGDLFVAYLGDYMSGTMGEVVRYDGTTGAFVGTFLVGGAINNPSSVVFGGPDGNLLVADPVADRVEEFDKDTGDFVRVLIGAIGGEFSLPRLAIGPNAHLYLAHYSGNVLGEFDPVDGTFIQSLPVYPDLVTPTGLVFEPPSNDCNENGVPDECEDCNGNRLADECDIASGYSEDSNQNGIPDECEGFDVELELVVRDAFGFVPIDSTDTLPQSDTLQRNAIFYLEFWATDRGPVNTGLEHVYADVSFPADAVYANQVYHRPPFESDPGGEIDNNAGTISNLGGRDASALGLGIEPIWRRIAVVQFWAIECLDPAVFTLSPSPPGVAAVDRGVLPDETVGYGSSSTNIVVPCCYDLDGSGTIDAGDLGMFEPCWLTGPGDVGWDPDCDFDCSGFVNAADLGWLAGAWLSECDNLTDDDVPECRDCDSDPS